MIGLHDTRAGTVSLPQPMGTYGGDSRRLQLSISHVVSSLNVGGMEHVVLRLAIAQKSQGHNVSVVALKGGPLAIELEKAGVQTVVLGGGRVAKSIRIARHFLSAKPDVVHAHNPTSLHYAVLSKFISKSVIVVTVHGDQQTLARTGSSLEWSLVASVVAVSNAAKVTLRLPCDQKKLTVIHNGIAPVVAQRDRREPTRRELGIETSFAGALVARIDGRKGHVTLLRSLKILKDEGFRIAVLMIGDGRELPALEELGDELSLGPETVQFMGSRLDVDRLLEAVDFFVLPSETEGLPMSVLEAMAHGLPIVASRIGGLPELIRDEEEGLLVPPGHAPALAAAIRRLYERPLLRDKLGRAALARATNEFSLAATVQNYDKLYRGVIAS